MIYINIVKSVLINELEKDHSMIVTRRLQNVVIFSQTILSFVLSRKIINICEIVIVSREQRENNRKKKETIPLGTKSIDQNKKNDRYSTLYVSSDHLNFYMFML